MSVLKQLIKIFKEKQENFYNKIYICIDIHNTILVPCWNNEETYEYFPYAREVLIKLSKMEDIVLILWSASYPDKLEQYLVKFKKDNINFKYINKNFEIRNNKISCFDFKLYCDIGIDDKFGFDAEIEWKEIFNYLENL